MSSTNRGGQRMPDDDYATPAWATRAILPHLPTLRRAHVVEPFAGEGAIVEVLLAEGIPRGEARDTLKSRLEEGGRLAARWFDDGQSNEGRAFLFPGGP